MVYLHDAQVLTMQEAQSIDEIESITEFTDYKTGDSVMKETALSNLDAKVLIVDEALEIKVAGDIVYYSNANKSDKNVLHSNGNGITVVVFIPKK